MTDKAKGRQGTTPTDLDSSTIHIHNEESTMLTNNTGVTIPTSLYPIDGAEVNNLDDIEVNIVKLPSYADIALPIFKMGYAALPASSIASKAPTVKYGWLSKEHPDAARVRQETAGWAVGAIDGVACWLLHSLQPTVTPHLDVIDVDDLSELPWALATFGPSPLIQHSGRDGGGCHIFYRRDPTRDPLEYGSRTHLGGKKVDHKSGSNGYVVAPGSIHKSGRFYRLELNGVSITFSDLTPEILWSLPILDRTILDAVVAEGRGQDLPLEDAGEVDPLYAELGLSPLPRGYSGRGGQSKSGLQRVQADPDAVTMRWGGTITAYAAGLADGSHRSACPHDDHKSDQGGGASYILSVSGGKAVSATCFACDSVYVYREAQQPFPLKRENKKVVTECPDDSVADFFFSIRSLQDQKSATEEIDLSDIVIPVPMSLVLMKDDLIDGKFIPAKDYAPTQSLALRAPQGAGKTEVMRHLVDSLRASNPNAIIQSFSHLVNLSKANAARLGLPNYKDSTGKIEGSVAIVINSLHRLERYGYDKTGAILPIIPDLLIIDESEQVLRALTSGTMTSHDAMDTQQALDYAIKVAKRVIVADADYSELTRDYINGLRPHDPLFLVDVIVPVEWEYQQVSDKLALEHEMLEAWTAGKKLFIPTFYSPTVAEALARRLRRIHPDKQVAVVSRATNTEFDLSTINDWASDYDAIICTPTMGTGVSVDTKDHFDAIYGFFENYVGAAQDARQIMHRVRYPKTNVIRFYAPDGGGNPEINLKEILLSLLRKEKLTISLAHSMGLLQKSPDSKFTQDFNLVEVENGKIRISHKPEMLRYLEHFAKVMVYVRKNGVECLGPALQKYLARISATTKATKIKMTPLDSSLVTAMKKEQTSAKEEIVAENNADLLASEVIDIELAKAMGEAKDRETSLKIERAYHTDFYGECTLSTLEFDREGKGRKQARRFSTMYLSALKQSDPLVAKDASAFEAGVAASHQKHLYFEGLIQHAILSWFGLGNLDDHKITETDLALAVTKMEKNATTLTDFGYAVTADSIANPLRFLGMALKKMGLRLKSEKYRVTPFVSEVPKVSEESALTNPTLNTSTDTTEVTTLFARRYWLDQDVLKKMIVITEHYRGKLQKNTVVTIERVEAMQISLTPELEQALLADLYAI